jgi:uncharacterized membrane protein
LSYLYTDDVVIMEKIINAVFDNEVNAFKGLQALEQLDLIHDMSLGESYVLTKNSAGETSIKSAKDKAEGSGVVSGALLGGLVGLLAGPLGFIVGIAGGMIAGSATETLRAEDRSDYLDVVSASIPNGKSILVAHVWEDWQAPVDAVLQPFTKQVLRFEVRDKIFDADFHSSQYQAWIDKNSIAADGFDQEKQKRLESRLAAQKNKLKLAKKGDQV